MKLHTKIISLLLVVGLSSAGAQSAGSSASNFYVKGSVGYADLESDGGLTDSFKTITAVSDLDMDLDSAVAYSLEGGMYFGENLSFGFEWTMFNSDAKASKDLTGLSLTTLSDFFGLNNNSPGGDFGAAVATFEEEIDVDRFMFTLNYEHYFNEQFSLLVNTGLGILNVEQTIKATQGTAQQVNSKADETLFAYQIGLSLGYHFNEALSLYGGGRFLAASDADFDHKTFKLDGFNPDALVYEVGMRYSF